MRFYGVLSVMAVALLAGVVAQAEPGIYLGHEAADIERQAATDLQRYMYIATDRVFTIQIVETVPADAEGVVVGTADSLPRTEPAWPFGLETPRLDGYILQSLREDGRLVAVAGAVPAGARNGVYGLLERLGFGFYLGGDTYPEESDDLPLFSESVSPVFAVRGTLPWHSFFNSPTTWELEDYKEFIDQLVRMRCSFVGFHAYDFEPFAAYEQEGRVVGGEPLANTSKPTWGAQPLATSDFFAGTGRFFAREEFGAASSLIEDRGAAIAEAKNVLREALAYAKGRGLEVCLGFEVHGDALDPAVQSQFEARLTALLDDYPMLDCVWLWEPEGQALNPVTTPLPRTFWNRYTERWSDAFADVPGFNRRAEATRLALFGLQAHKMIEALRPDARLVMSGWGGDQWLRCTDFSPGLDQVLPEDVVFSALDNIRVSSTVSDAYGKLPPDRQRWPVVWLEFDGDQWMPQPNLFELAGACRDAQAKGCQGLLGVHSRTRAVADSAAYCARFAWEPDLTPEAFCEDRARHLFGEDLGSHVAPYLIRLQKLGYRWVGGWGQSEGAGFSWRAGDEANRAELAQIGYDLRERLSALAPLGAMMSDLTGGVPADKRAALADLVAYIQYVLDMDAAAAALMPGKGLDDLVAEGETDQAIDRVRKSRLASAMIAYANRVDNKGELGVLATMNTKAWVDLRSRLGLEDGQLDSLEALPDAVHLGPRLLVLPDRVIVLGVPDDAELKVILKARPLDKKRFEKLPLERLGRTTYAMRFPDELDGIANIEYGIEARLGFRQKYVWPGGFPAETRTATRLTPSQPPSPKPSEPAPVEPPAPVCEVLPNQYAVHLSWESKPGEIYAVTRDDTALGSVSEGWFVDSAPPSDSTVRYSVTARQLGSGHMAAQYVSVAIPELPLPNPPKEIRATARAERIVLGWDSDSLVAEKYRITKLDVNKEVISEMTIDADYGQYLQATDKATEGQVASYTIAGITPDGRIGPSSRAVGVIATPKPLEPFVQLSFEDEAFLEGLAQLADNALALGGRGWAEMPSQPAWNPEDALTISLWVNLEDLRGMPVLVCKGAWQQAGYFLQILNGQVRFYIAGVDKLDAGNPQPGRWQMITAVYGRGQMRIYIDGKQVGRKRVTGSPTPSHEPLLLGRYGLSDEVYFVRGLMDEIRIYDVPLAAEEVQEIYTATKRE